MQIRSANPQMRRVLGEVFKIAPSDITVTISGETGTGKEVIAGTIHRHSARAAQPFVAVNCAAMPDGLLESQLFGHKRGAFTGAVTQHRGFFEQAHGGTLFLDEIGEAPLGLQAKLLRAIEKRRINPVGGSEEIEVDIRVMTATHRNLEEMVRRGSFRQDLFYRINGPSILHLPPLRDRTEDIPGLVHESMRRIRKERGLQVEGVSEGAMDFLRQYSWPGNIRELVNLVERMMVLTDGQSLDVCDLPVKIVQPNETGVTSLERCLAFSREFPDEGIDLHNVLKEVVEELKGNLLDAALWKTKGNITAAAALLRTSRRDFYNRPERVRPRTKKP